MIIVSLFTLDYATRIWLADRKLGFIFGFLGIIDLIAILSFFLASGLNLDLRSLRAFRLIRLIRALKLARYRRAVQRFHRALAIAREALILFFCVAGILLDMAAMGIYHFGIVVQPENFKSVSAEH